MYVAIDHFVKIGRDLYNTVEKNLFTIVNVLLFSWSTFNIKHLE